MKPIQYPIAPGTAIGAWKIHDHIGSGGQGAVWSAKPVKTKHAPFRAMKLCFASEEQGRGRFRREVELLLRCDSPHVLKVHDHDLEWQEHVPGLPAFAFYVTEKCHGSLEKRLRDLGDARRRLQIFRQVCSAVSYLHNLPEPIVHRDIKPENFLVAKELGNVVLADFGIARPLAASTLTEAFEVVGTQYYRAPEVSNGARGSVQSDVYSLGRVLEWLLTEDVSKDMGTRAVARGGELDDEACDILDRVIAKATQASAQNRFSSVRELADHLPDLWLSPRPVLKPAATLTSSDPASVLQTSLEFARTNDTLSWRQLEAQLRRDSMSGLLRWSAAYGNRSVVTKELVRGATDELVDMILPRLLFALAPAYVGKPSAGEVQRLIDDVTAIPGWPANGYAWVLNAPRSLVYLLHHVHGALCLSYQQMDSALRVAETPIASGRSNDISPLWHHSDLTGYPELLESDASVAWEYLRQLRTRLPVLETVFALQSDYDIGLASYSLALSLLELANDATQASPPDLASNHARFLVAPMLVRMDHNTIASAASRTCRNRAVVEAIAKRTGASVTTMQKMWPAWKALMSKYRRSDRAWWGELPLGELAEH